MTDIRNSLFVLVLILSPIASAAQRPIHVHAFQDLSCGAWVKSSGDGYEAQANRQIYLSWFRGFVTGHNFANPANQVDSARMPNAETLFLYVDKFCRDNPLLAFTAAAFRLVEETRERPEPKK